MFTKLLPIHLFHSYLLLRDILVFARKQCGLHLYNALIDNQIAPLSQSPSTHSLHSYCKFAISFCHFSAFIHELGGAATMCDVLLIPQPIIFLLIVRFFFLFHSSPFIHEFVGTSRMCYVLLMFIIHNSFVFRGRWVHVWRYFWFSSLWWFGFESVTLFFYILV
jgi:hypothetical protein